VDAVPSGCGHADGAREAVLVWSGLAVGTIEGTLHHVVILGCRLAVDRTLVGVGHKGVVQAGDKRVREGSRGLHWYS